MSLRPDRVLISRRAAGAAFLAAALVMNGAAISHAAAPSNSKLGVHTLLTYSNGAHTIINGHPRFLKIMFGNSVPDGNQLGAASDFKAGTPAGKVVLRIYTTLSFQPSDNPTTSGTTFFNNVLAPAINAMTPAQKALIDYMEGPNEGDSTPTFSTVAEAQWFNTFWLQLAPMISNAGFRPLFGSIAVGNPGGDINNQHACLDAVVPALRLCKSLGGGWSYHDYAGPAMTKDINTEIFFSLRYRTYYSYFNTAYPDLSNLPLICTEGGPFSGWTQFGTAYYEDWLTWHDQQIQQDAYYLGETLFSIGDTITWGEFDLEAIAPWLQSYLLAAAPSGPPSAPTGLTATPGDTTVSLSWNASGGATSYNVKRSTTSGGSYSTIATNVLTTSFLDTGRTNGTTYYYVVSATNSFGTSGNSSQASATPVSGSMNTNTPTGTNIALTATQYLADTEFDANNSGAKAKDGSLSTKWCTTGGAPPHWLAYDLGADLTVNGFIVRHAGAGGESTTYNTKNFKIQSGTSINGPWTDEVTVDNTAQANVTTRSYNTPKTLRYVRLYITNAGIDNYARIYEFEVWGVAGSGSSMNNNTPTGTNVAPSSTTVQVDTFFDSNTTGAKAVDGSTGTKWCTTGGAPPHWIALDLGSSKTVNGYIVRLASAGGESTTYNLKNFKFQSATSLSGPWTDEDTYNNSVQAGVVARSYFSPKALRYVRLNVTNCGIDNFCRLYEFEVWAAGGGGGSSTVDENFETMPAWASTFDAGWGSAATWSIVGGGQTANGLQTSRSSQGSSAKVQVYNISASTNYTISVYLKCPSNAGSYWMESAYRLGNFTASDFDGNAGAWTMIQKFSDTGTNGNANTWVQYSKTFNSGASTQISVGFKLGSSGGAGPTVMWDTLRVQ